MGYYVNITFTNANKIKEAFGSKDEKLYKAILMDFWDDFRDDDSYFSKKLEQVGATSKDILKDFINAEVRYPTLAFLYGYVYEKVCWYFENEQEPVVEELDTGLFFELISDYTTFVPLPTPEDFPLIYSIAYKDLEKERQRFTLTHLQGFDPQRLEISTKDFLKIFDQAKHLEADLVFALY